MTETPAFWIWLGPILFIASIVAGLVLTKFAGMTFGRERPLA